MTQQTYFVRIANNRCSMRYYAAALHRPCTAAFALTRQQDSIRLDRFTGDGDPPGTLVTIFGRFDPVAREYQRLTLRFWDFAPARLSAAIYYVGNQRTLDHHRSTLLLDARNLRRLHQVVRWAAQVNGDELGETVERVFRTLSPEAVSYGA